MTFIRRIPKRGCTNHRFKREWSFGNLRDHNQFADVDVVAPEECRRRGNVPRIRLANNGDQPVFLLDG